MKVIFLIWFSGKKFGFRMADFYLASRIDFEIWKCLIFDGTASRCLHYANKSFHYIYLGVKMYWISPASLWISTTVFTLLYSLSQKDWILLFTIYKKQINVQPVTKINIFNGLTCYRNCTTSLNIKWQSRF